MDNYYVNECKYKYSWCPGKFCDNELIKECSTLYSNHYGIWESDNSQNLTGKVKLSPKRIREILNIDNTDLYYAIDTQNNKIVGYAIALRKRIKYLGVFSWVTQLVVHSEHRKKGIAKNLLFSIWGLSNDYAWGIVTSNPYAVRALEKATRRRSIPLKIKRKIDKIIMVGCESVNYIDENTEYIVDKDNSKINTNFFVSHAEIEKKLLDVISKETPWLLGDLDSGWEWIAFTFHDQEQIPLTESEITQMIAASNDVVQLAYSRMEISEKQVWTKHTDNEVNYIIKKSGIKRGKTIIDFGCGIGRHSIALSKLGYTVYAVDYVKRNIENIKKSDKSIIAIEGDCRYISLGLEADLVICLYDVIGSFANEADNVMILSNLYKHLKVGGTAFISVMNYELTENIAKQRFNIKSNPNALLSINASNIMEQTGDVFNPDFYILDDSEHLIYRKESFTEGRELPVELIVRDKRFTKEEIVKMCSQVGFSIEYAHYVSAKDWNIPLSATDSHAKEILIKCTKKTL